MLGTAQTSLLNVILPLSCHYDMIAYGRHKHLESNINLTHAFANRPLVTGRQTVNLITSKHQLVDLNTGTGGA